MVSEQKNRRSPRLKVLYIGNFSINSVGEPEIAWALEQLGHTVKQLPETGTTIADVKNELNRSRYDLLLFAKFRVGTSQEVREFLQQLRVGLYVRKTPSVCWLFDLYWGYRRENEIKMDMLGAFAADVVFTTDGGHEAMWKRYRINHFLLRQGIDERVKVGKPVFPTKAEIGFIGSRLTWAGWPYRGQLIDFLSATYGDRFGHFGDSSNGMKEVRHEELNNLFATLKIVLCDTVYSPYYWSNRIYETIGRGGFAIHPRVEGLSSEFKEFEHFIPYQLGNFKDLKNKIDFYLSEDKRRETIRKAGFDYCHQTHTYKNRVKELLRMLEEQKVI